MHSVERSEPCVDGWCGTTDGVAVYGHGVFNDVQTARLAIIEKFGVVRDSDPNGDLFSTDEEGVLEIHKPGKYAPMSIESTADWLSEEVQMRIGSDTTDAEIEELTVEFEEAANSQGYTLDSSVDLLMRKRRQELKDELEGDASNTFDMG